MNTNENVPRCIECSFMGSRFTQHLECRRFPPQITRFPEARFPLVEPFDWCGEFKPKSEDR